MGILERGKDGKPSRVRTKVIPTRRKSAVQPQLRNHVAAGSAIYTDDLKSYEGLTEFEHGVIDHAEKYVDGQIHTNGLENFWSCLKRTLGGTYVSVEPFHLFRYRRSRPTDSTIGSSPMPNALISRSVASSSQTPHPEATHWSGSRLANVSTLSEKERTRQKKRGKKSGKVKRLILDQPSASLLKAPLQCTCGSTAHSPRPNRLRDSVRDAGLESVAFSLD